MMMTPRHTLRDHPWNLSVISHESPRRLGSRADTWFCHVLQASLNDTVWCCMMLCFVQWEFCNSENLYRTLVVLHILCHPYQGQGGAVHDDGDFDAKVYGDSKREAESHLAWSGLKRMRLKNLVRGTSWGTTWHNHQDGCIAYDLWCLYINPDSVNLLFDACCVSSDLRIQEVLTRSQQHIYWQFWICPIQGAVYRCFFFLCWPYLNNHEIHGCGMVTVQDPTHQLMW